MSLHQIYLEPTDLLFFRDGRPMGGSLTGHTAAWPLPDVTNHALHAALHRAALDRAPGGKLHAHRRGRSGRYSSDAAHRDRKFGSLLTAGPFPVRLVPPNGAGPAPDNPNPETEWFFPRPRDAQLAGSVLVTMRPGSGYWRGTSSLRQPLSYAVVNTLPPRKEAGTESWFSVAAYQAYLDDSVVGIASGDSMVPGELLDDSAVADTEQYLGIGMDAATGTVAEKLIYSAHYLRLREGFRLGLVAEAMDHDFHHHEHAGDLVATLLRQAPQSIMVGGQQRACTACCVDPPATGLPLPRGMRDGFSCALVEGREQWLVKWILLTPAIWPEIPPGPSLRGTVRQPHPGGWLPNWVCPESGGVLLEKVGADERARRRKLSQAGTGYASKPNIAARLVAAIVPKPIVVTGWSLGGITRGSETGDGVFQLRAAGAKSTHLAVAAGAVYYFQAESAAAARDLAEALNWHNADTPPLKIRNRRSTLLGEKGYGLGVCGTWTFAEEQIPRR